MDDCGVRGGGENERVEHTEIATSERISHDHGGAEKKA